MELGAHDKPAAEGLGRSAEHDSITHCSSLLTACFSSSSPSSLSEEGRTKSLPPCAYQTSITHSPLPTINRLQASTLWCENVKAFCDTLSSVWNHRAPDNVLFLKNKKKQKKKSWNKHNDWQSRTSALAMRLQSTLLALSTGHICIGVTHSTLLCKCIRKGVYQPELILHSGSHCLCCTLVTNIACYSDTSHALYQRLMFQSG